MAGVRNIALSQLGVGLKRRLTLWPVRIVGVAIAGFASLSFVESLLRSTIAAGGIIFDAIVFAVGVGVCLDLRQVRAFVSILLLVTAVIFIFGVFNPFAESDYYHAHGSFPTVGGILRWLLPLESGLFFLSWLLYPLPKAAGDPAGSGDKA